MELPINDLGEFRTAIGGNDGWMARTPAAFAEPGAHWSHYSAFASLFLTMVERRGRDVPGLLPDESSELFRLNRALVLALRGEVERAGARFRMRMIPGERKAAAIAGEGQGYSQPLVQSLRSAGIEVIDLTERLLEAGVDQSESIWILGGHHSPRTHEIVADIILEEWGE